MLINADFSKIVIIKPEDYHWVKSPRGEVERVMFDRIGDEVARATSLVKYPPDSIFPKHQHPLGEEILVLSGVFTENTEHDYPAGWYLRNPHNSIHQASSQEGTLIFVKLMQMSIQETEKTQINTTDPTNWISSVDRMICPLFKSEDEQTYLEKLVPHQIFIETSDQGIEVFIIEGQLFKNTEIYPSGSWIRLPPKCHANFQADTSGATLYVKTNHLLRAQKLWNDKS